MESTGRSMALPGIKHKVIGLVSGGKDSCFNLMHAVANGHDIVALATLTPGEGIDELDSHMYQSVGTALPPLIAQAMGLPHYSGVIRGKPVEQGMEYGSRERGGEGSGQEGDETEDLTALLRTVMTAHPEATAVSSGAILSNYQRLRIEHVCQRLGLTSLSYLWQSEQLPLVTKMTTSGLDAILVKVAGIGLREQHVGMSLAQLIPYLTRLQMQYGAHPAGEGGEYETLTLDTPLFSHRIRIVESEVVVSDPEPNLVAYLRVRKAELDPKEGWVQPSVATLRGLLGLDEDEEAGAEGLDEQGLEVFDRVKDMQVDNRRDIDPEEIDSHENSMEIPALDVDVDTPVGTQTSSNGDSIKVDGDSDSDEMRRPTRGLRPMTSTMRKMQGAKGPRKGPQQPSSPPADDEESDEHTPAFSLAPPPSLVAAAKAAKQEEESPYAVRFVQRGRWFVASAGGQDEGDVAAELRAALDSVKSRLEAKGLSLPVHAAHVTLILNSMSDFAAANAAYIQYFGTSPPSRACISVPLGVQHIRVEVVGFDGRPQFGRPIGNRTALHVQGQSYWAPANIGPYSQAVTVDARVHVAGQIALQPASLTLAPYPAETSPYGHQAALALQHVRHIVEVLRSPTSSGGGWYGWIESCVAWWARPKGCGAEGPDVSRAAWRAWAEENGAVKAPVLFARAAELPRGALVEYQVNVHTGRPSYNSKPVDDDDSEEEEEEVEYKSGVMFPGTYREQVVGRGGSRGARTVVFFETALALSMPYLINHLLSLGDESTPLALRVYHRGELPDGVAKVAGTLRAAWTAIPVLDVQDRNGVSYPLAFDVFSV
ncbi:hypothetical protein CcaverHIS002_0602160 [Cutaneotrichosporon cavernicola]|uniref:Diphthine--ammonia ligase n=1 Tax=Cutaneotrichosporon cavernicola TaxID=279322 RepID=A0AA48QXT3_9TREE|nr:uncharacterized protein CcaverHIS019_0601660 [Cutaneotrichosporon cavernicola]BEI85929.1 hypothetical protein CcaverHIS002_0602160 [Cutaneotrichosporon cavernicola]BEI93707.1 hypothetical protein CcaverHIS019_0601660 [Cutaneotrichosporon cavernicola]BEJ09250.1 hypothetical protein CcaverHIS641_0601650 [Cutaneotrichosporon cavernicola]